MLEYSYPRTRNNITITILEYHMLDQHIRKGYNFIHLGLIQVATIPNYQLGVNMPIMMLLRDIRLLQFKDSVIVVMERNLHDGPAFFNCYPNFSIDLNNPRTIEAIKLYLRTPDIIVDEVLGLVRIIYRTIKVTKIDYNFKALRESPKDETIFVEANLSKSSVQVPKRLSHEKVLKKIPEE